MADLVLATTARLRAGDIAVGPLPLQLNLMQAAGSPSLLFEVTPEDLFAAERLEHCVRQIVSTIRAQLASTGGAC